MTECQHTELRPVEKTVYDGEPVLSAVIDTELTVYMECEDCDDSLVVATYEFAGFLDACEHEDYNFVVDTSLNGEPVLSGTLSSNGAEVYFHCIDCEETVTAKYEYLDTELLHHK